MLASNSSRVNPRLRACAIPFDMIFFAIPWPVKFRENTHIAYKAGAVMRSIEICGNEPDQERFAPDFEPNSVGVQLSGISVQTCLCTQRKSENFIIRGKMVQNIFFACQILGVGQNLSKDNFAAPSPYRPNALRCRAYRARLVKRLSVGSIASRNPTFQALFRTPMRCHPAPK